jgi:hypothetical protein
MKKWWLFCLQFLCGDFQTRCLAFTSGRNADTKLFQTACERPRSSLQSNSNSPESPSTLSASCRNPKPHSPTLIHFPSYHHPQKKITKRTLCEGALGSSYNHWLYFPSLQMHTKQSTAMDIASKKKKTYQKQRKAGSHITDLIKRTREASWTRRAVRTGIARAVEYSCSNTVGWESVSSAIASAVALLDIQTNKQAHQQQRARTLGLYRWGINQYWAVLWLSKTRRVLSLKFPWRKNRRFRFFEDNSEPNNNRFQLFQKPWRTNRFHERTRQWIVGPVDTYMIFYIFFRTMVYLPKLILWMF